MTQTLLRRTAESLYWAGRDLEQTEGLARIVLVHGNTHMDLPVGEDVGWAPLLAVAHLEREFAESYPGLAQGRSSVAWAIPETQVIEFLLTSPMNQASVLATVTKVREALRSARPVIPREAWELTNALWLSLRESRQDVADRTGRARWLREVIASCERINGTLWGSMRRDSALAVMRTGQHLERAELTCRFLSVRAESALADTSPDPYDHVRAMSLLRSLGAYQQYRRAMPARPNKSLVEFVVQDEAFPRAVAACLAQVRQQLKDLPRNEEALAACMDASVLAATRIVPGMTPAELRALLDELNESIRVIHERIDAELFADRPSELAHGELLAPKPTASRPREATKPLRRYRIVHQTTYTYDAPVEESHNEAHLRPRNTLRQRIREHSIDIHPEPVSRSELVDAWGNYVTSFVVRGNFEQMSVISTSEVELVRSPPPPTGPPWESVRSTLDRDRRMDTRAARMFRAPSRLVPNSMAVATYAAESFEPHRPVIEALRELCSRIHRDFAYEPGFTSVTTPLLEVFEARRGVCQDFAHVAICCLRSVGLAARYVSGYIETFRSAGALTGADASHAWASTYLPGWGWVDIDPTNDLVVCEEHVTTAWGRDYHDVSPLRGSVIGGGPSHTLDVAVTVERIDSH